jgi:protein tyrosine phosphatase (PTP) superfamily phosphohydrolase (DUF442 family)
MLMRQWFQSGGFGRGAPPSGRRGPLARRLALVALALATLAIDGCSSLNNGCRGCGSGLFNGCGFGRRLFNRGAAADGCESPLGGAPLEAAPVIGAPGAVITAPAAESESVPRLESAPSAGDAPAQGQQSQNKRTLYETYQSTSGGTSASRPPSRPRGSARLRAEREPAVPAEANDPLVNLPPLSPPVDPASRADSPPAAPVAKEAASAADTQANTPPAPSAPAAEPAGTGATPSSGAAGFARFASVDSQLSGGSLPTEAGWTFLAEKGYRTVIDLREHTEVRPEDAAAADRAGLIRVALPITSATLDATHLKRFEDAIAQNGSRPLYFFDADGSRAAALWYVHLVVTEKRDPADAFRKAEEIGPKDAKTWEAAEHLVVNVRPTPPVPQTVTVPAPAPAAPAEKPHTPSAALDAAPSVPTVKAVAQVEPRALAPILDANTWRPYLALLVAALGVPIAYFGCSAFNVRAIFRASLPAPARRLKSLPAASGE